MRYICICIFIYVYMGSLIVYVSYFYTHMYIIIYMCVYLPISIYLNIVWHVAFSFAVYICVSICLSFLIHFKQKQHPLTCCIVKIVIWQVRFLPFLILRKPDLAYPPSFGPSFTQVMRPVIPILWMLRCRRWTCRSAESAWLQPG